LGFIQSDGKWSAINVEQEMGKTFTPGSSGLAIATYIFYTCMTIAKGKTTYIYQLMT